MEPKVKFKGFEGEWSKVKLCSISKKVTTRNMDMKYTTTLTNSAEHGIIDQLAFFDHQVSNNDNISGYYVVENGDFVYNPRISALAPVGPINQSQIGYTGVMSPLYYVFRVDGVDTDYLSYYFKTTLWHQYLKDVGNSGARFDRLAITDGDFQEMPISLPTNREEQHAIASYFRTLDAKLQASAKKVESLKKLKSASLVAMFPQQGKTTPKVRFKGFEGEWKTPSIGDVFELRNGYTPSKIVKEFWEGGTIPWFRMEDIRMNGGFLKDALQHITPLAVKGAGLFEKNSIILATTATIGVHAMLIADSLANQRFTNFKVRKSLSDEYIDEFIYYSFFKIDEWSKNNTNSGGLLSVNMPLLVKQSFLTPCKEEQQAIATFFRSLDRKIALETARLEKLKQIKLACLDKMFV